MRTTLHLHAGLVALHPHGQEAVGGRYFRHGAKGTLCFRQHIVMVKSGALLHLVVRCKDPVTDAGALPAVKGCAFHRQDAAGAGAGIVDFGKGVGIQHQRLIQNIALVVFFQVEIAVVGQIDHRIPAADCRIVDPQGRFGQGKSDSGIQFSGIPSVAIQAHIAQRYKVLPGIHHLKGDIPEAFGAAMEMIGAFICLQPKRLTADLEGGAADAVGAAPDHRANVVRGPELFQQAVQKVHRHVYQGIPAKLTAI